MLSFRSTTVLQGSGWQRVLRAILLAVVLWPAQQARAQWGVSWAHDIEYWFDAEDRVVRASRYDLSGDPPSLVDIICDNPYQNKFQISLAPDSLVTRITLTPETGYGFYVYLQNTGFDNSTDFETFSLRAYTDTSGIAYSLRHDIRIDGLPVPDPTLCGAGLLPET